MSMSNNVMSSNAPLMWHNDASRVQKNYHAKKINSSKRKSSASVSMLTSDVVQYS